MNNLFTRVQMQKPNRNVFDLTHDVKTSFNMGQLIPTCILEAIPGDKFHISVESLTRFAPLISPVMHRLDITTHYFFVPYRLLWSNWTYYITGTNNPTTGLPSVFPFMPAGNSGFTVAIGSLADYLGLPLTTGATGISNISALPFYAYQLIWQEYYRDENLITAPFRQNTPPAIDGDNSGTILGFGAQNLRVRAWEHDYFTAALPFAQKGNAVSLPLGNVQYNFGLVGTSAIWRNPTTQIATPAGALAVNASAQTTAGAALTNYDPNGTLTIAPTTINDLRRAFKLQEWLERNARGGTRYIEHILAHFGVQSSDKRLQRPEFICGAKSPIIISEVLNTGGDQATLPQGNMAGHGIGVQSGRAGSYYCEEHGYIMGITSIMPKTAYYQGIPKHWSKVTDYFDFFWPEFAHLGEQPIFNREIFGWGTLDSQTFGYTPRYAEYKYENSRVCGDFRGTLAYWHLARTFASLPTLNQTFIECVPDPRIFAVTDPAAQKMYCHILNKIKVSRLMPRFGTPLQMGGV